MIRTRSVVHTVFCRTEIEIPKRRPCFCHFDVSVLQLKAYISLKFVKFKKVIEGKIKRSLKGRKDLNQGKKSFT